MSEIQAVFGKRLHDLRRTKCWSQPEVGRLIGTSGAIIGGYERGEMAPSIEVPKKPAETFGSRWIRRCRSRSEAPWSRTPR